MNRKRTLKSLALGSLCGLQFLVGGCGAGDGLSLEGSSTGPQLQTSDGSRPSVSQGGPASANLGALPGAVLAKNSPSTTSASVLWRDPQSAQVAIWRLDGQGSLAGASPIAHVSSDWVYRGNGDFNGDGWPDILWQRKDTRTLALWMLNNNQVVSQANLPTPSAGWDCIGVADFNRDGIPDVLWQNTTSGAVAYWRLSRNLSVGGTTSMGTAPGAPWTARAVGDLRRDGAADVVWQNGNQIRIWNWGGSSMTEVVNTGLPSNMEVRASQDFNSDGYADLLLQNPGSQETGFLRLNWSGRTVYQKLSDANRAWTCLGGLAAATETSPRINLAEGNGEDSVLTVLLPGVPSQPKSVQWTIAGTVVKSGTPLRQFFPLGGSYQIQADVLDAQSNRLQLVSFAQVRGRNPWPCSGGNAQGNCRSWVDAPNNKGRLRWATQLRALRRYETWGPGYDHSMAVGGDGTIYTYQGGRTPSAAVVALNPDSSEKWSYEVDPDTAGKGTTSNFCLTEDGVIYAGINIRLYAFNSDGSLKWTRLNHFDCDICDMKVGIDNNIYVGDRGFDLVAHTPDGVPRWNNFGPSAGFYPDYVSLALTPQGAIGFFGAEYPHDGLVINNNFGAVGAFNFCYDQEGSRYSVEPASSSYPQYKYTTKRRGNTQAWLWDNLETGNPPKALAEVPPRLGVAQDGSTCVLSGRTSSVNGSMVYLNPDGTLRWAKYFQQPSLTPSRVYEPILTADGSIIVAWERGELYCFSPDGTQRWVFRPPGAFNPEKYFAGPPAIGPDGTIYVKTYDGVVYAVY